MLGVNISGNVTARDISANTTWDLTGNVNLQGCITIKSGYTLTINPNGAKRTIKATVALVNMFYIEPGGTLKITGDATNFITIDGGATVSRNSSTGVITKTSGLSFTNNGEAIQNRGTLNLNYVVIQNCFGVETESGKNNSGAGIYIRGEANKKSGQTILNYCTIQNCASNQGAAIHIASQNQENTGNTSESCKVHLTGCKIQYNYASAEKNDADGGKEGGIIRTNGGAVGNLIIEKCMINDNYSGFGGGSLYWNGKGSTSTIVKIIGSTFQNNKAAYRGGGMMLEADFEFQKASDGTINRVINNSVTGNDGTGGGIVVTGYGGNGFPKQELTTFKFDLNNSLLISNNSAPNGGGISFDLQSYSLWSSFASDIDCKVVVNVTIDGAEITNNKSTGNGGGMRLQNGVVDKFKEHDIKVNVIFNSGKLTGNTAKVGGGLHITNTSVTNSGTTGKIEIKDNTTSSNGGAIFLSRDVNHKIPTTSVDFGNADIINNHSTGNGGAVYINCDKGVTLSLNNSLIENNSAINGGAVYVSGGSVKLNNPTLKGNGNKNGTIVSQNGGAIYVSGTGSGFTATGTATIQNNASSTAGGGIYVNGGNVNMATSTISGNQSNDGGGVYVLNGSFTTTGATNLESNTSSNYGGALYVQGGSTTMNTPTLKNNSATNSGGAIYSTGTVTSNGKSIISGNSAKNGGAIYTTGSVELKGDLDMTGNKATGNTDSKGGAVYIAGYNSNFTVTGTSSISTNESTFEGGAIYVDGGSVSMGKTTLSGNKSQDGGAIYSSGTVTINGESTIENNSGANGGAIYTTGSVSLKGNSTMNNNTATGDGGVMYVEGGDIDSNGNSVIASGNKAVNGGVFRVNGSIVLGYTEMKSNIASANGGAVALYNGKFSMADDDGNGKSSSIVDNSATNYGGGLYIYSQNAIDEPFAWKGGIFSNNTAKVGGAVAVDAPITLNFSATMENNIAENGGGLYLSQATMNFGDGLVRRNQAIQPESNKTQYTTAKNLDASSVSGVGGGIFMANGATLNFESGENLGIYNNFATNAGADICANGSNTTLNLPNPTNLNLKGFDVPTERLDWIEDYFNGESSSNTNNKLVGIRYEKLLQVLKTDNGDDIEDYMIPYGESEQTKAFSNYICVDLGYDLVYVDLTVLGLKNLDHAAIICSYKDKTDDIIKEYRKILFTGNGADGGVKRVVALPSGDWQFTASDWSYNYKDPVIKPGVKGGSFSDSPIGGNNLVYISNKTEGGAGGYNAISAEFELQSNGDTSKARVKQFQAEKVNRMVRN